MDEKRHLKAVFLAGVATRVREEPGRPPVMYVAKAQRQLTDQEPVEAEWLGDHLIYDHGRPLHEIAGLPLRAVHELEHFDESLGLLALHHSHTD
jgi:hypothetical protein